MMMMIALAVHLAASVLRTLTPTQAQLSDELGPSTALAVPHRLAACPQSSSRPMQMPQVDSLTVH
jgi:hypothetical protein